MSLDVSLYGEAEEELCCECGKPRMVSHCIFDANITHNLNKMAKEAGIYKHLWRPEELGITRASELIQPLSDGLALLKSERTRFEKHNPKNNWGSYAYFVPWVEKYLNACKENPNAEVKVSR